VVTDVVDSQPLRFQIDPEPGESARACTAIARAVLPPTRGNVIVLGLYVAVGIAAFALTPATALVTLVIGLGAVLATVFALQFEVRSRLRRIQASDPHARESHFVELTPEGLRAWCAHVDARYPWRDFSKVTENGEFYLFARPNGSGSAIPKRLLEPVTEAALRERILEWSPDHGSGLARQVPG
jgi:hypothetical protein